VEIQNAGVFELLGVYPRAPTGAPTGLGSRTAGRGTLCFQFPFHLGDRPHNGEKTAPGRRGGINVFPQGDERDVLLGEVGDEVQPMGEGPGHAAALGHDHGISRTPIPPQLFPPGSRRSHSTDLIREDFEAPRLGEGIELGIEFLASHTHTGIADFIRTR